MITTELKALVLDEAKKIKEFATPEEIQRLDPRLILPYNGSMCIYGQMTGDCFSDRAIELLNKCAIPYSDGISEFVYTDDDRFADGSSGILRAYSPIECYIADEEAYKLNLARFIKGEISETDLIL